jgi:hypothetical protein
MKSERFAGVTCPVSLPLEIASRFVPRADVEDWGSSLGT